LTRTLGSVRGAAGNGGPYRDQPRRRHRERVGASDGGSLVRRRLLRVAAFGGVLLPPNPVDIGGATSLTCPRRGPNVYPDSRAAI
jgi:hypothetical protein